MKHLYERAKDRTSLETVVPLDAPFVLIIEPSSYCNFKCDFCPNGDENLLRSVGRTPSFMSMELFKKLISEIKCLPQKIKSIILQGDGEPLLHKNIAEMINIIKNDYGCEHVELTTNISLLTPKISDDLVSAGLDKIKLSVNGLNCDDYKKFCGVKIDYDEIIENVKYFYENKKDCFVYVKSIDFIMDNEGRLAQFHSLFDKYSDYCNIERSINWTSNHLKKFSYENNDTTFDGHEIVAGQACPFPLYASYVSADGRVGVCSDDWARATVYGDIKNNTYSEIWNGEKLYDFRMMHLNFNDRENTACNHCNFRKMALENIDSHVDVIKNNLTSHRMKGVF